MQTTEDLLTMLALKPDIETEQNAENAITHYKVLENFIYKKRSKKALDERVVIIGGGIVSLMTANYLLDLGIHVTIIEKGSMGTAASGRNGGAVMLLGRELLEVPFAKHSIRLWKNLKEDGIHTQFERAGHLMVAQNDLEVERLVASYHFYMLAGVDVKLLDFEEMKQYVTNLNPEAKLGLFCAEDAQSYPFTTIQSLIRKIRANGGDIITNEEVVDFTIEHGEIKHVTTCSNQTIKGDQFILAAGPWSEKLAANIGETVKVRPRRSQLMVTEIVKKRVITPFFTGNGFYSRQTPYGNILYGGGGPWEVDGYNVKNTQYGMSLLATRFTEMFPEHEDLNLIRSFAGTVEITPDFVPCFGRMVNIKNGFVSAGYNGHGYGLSAVMGKLMSCMIYDKETYEQDDALMQVLQPLNIKRFNERK